MKKYAYFCAKCQSTKTDPTWAREFAKTIGLDLWVPAEHVVNCKYPDGALECFEAIKGAECVIVQPPVGADCGWEMGAAHVLGKSTFLLKPLPEDDWMTKIGVTPCPFGAIEVLRQIRRAEP